jgi:hypothetical protein
MIKIDSIKASTDDNTESTFKQRYKGYLKVVEYVVLIMVLFIMAIIFWHLMAYFTSNKKA